MNLYILFLTIVILYILYNYFVKKDIIDNDIFKYSLMVHLQNDPISQKRMNEVKKIYQEYELPINIMPATHWKHDENEISTYPIEKNDIMMNRPGAYGLTGSFYKCLKKAYDNEWPYLIFLEDDAIPILSKDKFKKRFNDIISTMPDDKNDIYMLGIHVYCKTNKNEKIEWTKFNNINIYTSGTHAIYIGKKSINDILSYLNNNKIDLPIDEWLKKFNPWIWYGDLSDNGMFRGLYKQLNINCENVFSLEGPINNKI